MRRLLKKISNCALNAIIIMVVVVVVVVIIIILTRSSKPNPLSFQELDMCLFSVVSIFVVIRYLFRRVSTKNCIVIAMI